MSKVFEFLHSDDALKVGVLVCIAAAVVSRTAPVGSWPFEIARGVEDACVALGISSTLSRARK
jgi:hypothetical protein